MENPFCERREYTDLCILVDGLEMIVIKYREKCVDSNKFRWDHMFLGTIEDDFDYVKDAAVFSFNAFKFCAWIDKHHHCRNSAGAFKYQLSLDIKNMLKTYIRGLPISNDNESYFNLDFMVKYDKQEPCSIKICKRDILKDIRKRRPTHKFKELTNYKQFDKFCERLLKYSESEYFTYNNNKEVQK